jgi:hypothetical protein
VSFVARSDVGDISRPRSERYTRQVGRARGKDIVQEGRLEDGVAIRWSFTEIEPDAFRWLGERSHDGAASWQLQADFRARRVAA